MERRTIRDVVSEKYSVHINAGGLRPASWGTFDWSAEPDPSVEWVEVVLPPDPDLVTREHFPSLKKGFEIGLQSKRTDGRLVTGVRVEIARVYRHPPDWRDLGSLHGSHLLYDLLREHGVVCPALDPAWLACGATALARGVRASRDPAGLTILADSLEDAGCDDGELLAHLRGGGPHEGGCWALDLILGVSRGE